MRHGSLESGIGCFDYAAEMMNWENVFHVEINTFCQTILKYYWPNAKSFTNIFEFDGIPYRGFIDIITCGFPCQPFSLAGKGKGDKDDRFIWPENMRIIREIQPPYVVAENVPGLLSKHPLVFERVCADLENEGYQVVPVNIPACAAEEDHIRARLFFVAYNPQFRKRRLSIQQREQGQKGFDVNGEDKGDHSDNNVKRLERKIIGSVSANTECIGQPSEAIERESWPEAATRLCSVDDGTAGRLDTIAISKAKWYRESIRGYGNAVHWQIAYQIFKAIEQTR